MLMRILSGMDLERIITGINEDVKGVIMLIMGVIVIIVIDAVSTVVIVVITIRL